MATTDSHAQAAHKTHSKTTPKDFFLWAGLLIALYGSITAFISLVFEYISYAFPDALAGYGDPYGSAVRMSMAALIVFVPILLALMRIIHADIAKEAGKAVIWVRRWALVLTLFLAGLTIAIDLITLINTFLGGELTMRFVLKVLVVLLVAAGVFMHYLADLRGYWVEYPRRALSIAVAVSILTVWSIATGFLVIGTPQDIRLMRYDAEKVSDLQTIQYQIVNYYQQKQVLPASLDVLNDPLLNFTVPTDPQTHTAYEYKVESKTSFTLCADFSRPTPATSGRGAFPAYDVSYPSESGIDDSWQHDRGRTCFTRTIDPERYPPLQNAAKGL